MEDPKGRNPAGHLFTVTLVLEATDGCSTNGGPEREESRGEPVASFIVYLFLS